MLEKLYVDNYRCLVNFELRLKELSLLLGPNGAGKSSVLDVIHALAVLLEGRAKLTDPEVFPSRTLTRWQKHDIQIFEAHVRLDTDSFVYRLEVEHDRSNQRARIHLESLTGAEGPLFECRKGDVQLFRDDHSKGPSFSADWSESALARVASRRDNKRLSSFMDFMAGVTVCRIDPPAFHSESRNEARLLNRDASNFADWYRHVLQERPELILQYTHGLREVIGGLNTIRLERIGQDTRALMVVFDELGERYELRLGEVSDGQRALIALYASIHLAEGTRNAVFLDEPDNYVALPEIQPWLMSLADACGESVSQAVVCSHHPELIDYLGADSGLLLQRKGAGAVTASDLEVGRSDDGLKLSELIARGWMR